MFLPGLANVMIISGVYVYIPFYNILLICNPALILKYYIFIFSIPTCK